MKNYIRVTALFLPLLQTFSDLVLFGVELFLANAWGGGKRPFEYSARALGEAAKRSTRLQKKSRDPAGSR